MLSYNDKTIKSIIHRFMNFEKMIKIPAFSENDVCSLIAYLRYESTILFHLGEVEYTFFPSVREAVLKPCYLYSRTEYETLVTQLTATVQKIRDQICVVPTVLERELSIHDALCSIVTYVDDGDDSHSIIGPLLYHRGVCDGISKAAKVLLQECGIRTHIIHGTANDVNRNTEPHAWNVVCIGGKWYHLDITFDNTLTNNIIRYDYFNISTEQVLLDHQYDTNAYIDYLCCTQTDYYKMKNLLFTSKNNLVEYIINCLQTDRQYIQFRYIGLDSIEINSVINKLVSLNPRVIGYCENHNPIRNVYVNEFIYAC